MSKLNQVKIPLNLINETPQNWVVVKIPYEGETLYKVFAGWRGGYLDGDRWKLNSGIVKVEEDENYFYFFGYSGSCYKCNKEGYGIKEGTSYFGSYASGILDKMMKDSGNAGIELEILDEDTNWNDLVNTK